MMLGRLFNRRAGRAPVAQPSTPAGTVIWAVGDIHGRLDLLEAIVPEILADLQRTAAPRRAVVFLGDHIDRGPDSKGVIDRLRRLKAETTIETHVLRGNHENHMEAFLTRPSLGPGWCDHGGRETLMSYGVTPPRLRTDQAAWAAASAALNAAVSAEHRAFLESQAPCVSIGDYFFAHAGARPGAPLADQNPQDLMGVRQVFLDHPDAFEQMIVHGHTPSAAVHADHRRIGLDTGAYATGVLTALRLENTAREILQTAVLGGEVILTRRPM